MRREFEIFRQFIRSRGLRSTLQREQILDIFLSTERHISAEELYVLVKKHDARIGCTTVYRTMRLFAECGLCGRIDFGDGVARYEHRYNHEHHDHLVCTRCGRLVEVVDPEIERLQGRLFASHGFYPERHRMELYGVCRRCKRLPGKGRRMGPTQTG